MENIEKSLTGQKDTDLLILSNLDDESLLKFCQTSKYGQKLCQNENLWLNRFIDKFGDISLKYKSSKRTWKNFYLSLVIYWNNAENEVNQAMFNAAKNKDKDAVLFYISQGAKNWNMGLEGAAEGGDLKLVNLFIRDADNFDSAMVLAAEHGHFEIADHLFQSGADPNYGLKTEAFKGNLELVKYFVELNADNLGVGLRMARLKKHKDIVNYLESQLAKTNI